jgi:NAD(P)-dependent dehydrogenase (short-subunit alcohol dehydrogenase family)
MGPATIALFRVQGAEVIADGAAQDIVEAAGHIDLLFANLAADAEYGIMAIDTDEVVWQTAFAVMLHPLHRLCRTVLPRHGGNILDRVL